MRYIVDIVAQLAKCSQYIKREEHIYICIIVKYVSIKVILLSYLPLFLVATFLATDFSKG